MIRKNERGITLIALVVTIIVLIILATVSINMVAGENGLIKKAQQSKDAYEESSKREEEGLDSMEEEYDYLMELRKLPQGPTGKPLVEGLTEIQKRTVKAEDKYGKEVTVPKGFKVKPECGTDVNGGIVIEDEDGNQFVWVPCTEEQYKKHNYVTQKVNDKSSIVADTGNDSWKTYKYRQYTDWTEEVDINVNKESVKNNGGFYIGRYEAGVPSNASFYVGKDTETKTYEKDNKKNVTQENGTDLKPVSKSGNQCWNYISQVNAKVVSENMYKNEGESNEYGVRSQLVDGIAWDVVMNWITNEDGKKSMITDSTNYGNYLNNTNKKGYGLNAIYTKNNDIWTTGQYNYGEFNLGGEPNVKLIELATGSVSNFMLKNIYDMAGNMYEWTTETGYHSTTKTSTNTGTKFAVRRGGGFGYDGLWQPLSDRHGLDPVNSSSFTWGFRVVLYIN